MNAEFAARPQPGARTIGIPQFVADELVAHITTHPSTSDLVFSMSQGGPLDYNRFRSRYWNPAVEASVGQLCTPHDLRHTHVAMLIAHGESPKYIADRLGHESTRTVFDVYGHLYEGIDEAATDRLEQARNASRADQTRTKLVRRSLSSLLERREPSVDKGDSRSGRYWD